LLVLPVSYESTAKVVIEPPGSEAFSLQAAFPGISEPDYIETQAQILRGDNVGVEVVRVLRLDRSALLAKKTRLEAFIVSLHVDALLRPLRGDENVDAVVDSTHLAPTEMRALEFLKTHLVVTPVRNSRVIEVLFKCSERELSAQIANTVVQRFIEDSNLARFDAVMQSSQWLTKQLEDVRNISRNSQALLKRYQEAHGIVDVDDRQNIFSERESELIHYHAQAQADKIQLKSLLMGVRLSGVGSVPQFRDNPITQQLAMKNADVSVLLSQALVTYGEKNPEIEKLRNQRAELEKQSEAHERNVLIQLQTSYRAAELREKTLADEVNQEAVLLNRASRYGILRRDAQAGEDLYNSLYARVKEAGIAAGSKSSNIRMIERGLVPFKASWPNLMFMLPIGLIVACLGGVAAGVVREGMDLSVRSPEDVSFVAGRARLVLLPETRRRGRRDDDGLAIRRALKGQGKNGVRVDRFMLEQPASASAESIRALMGLILLRRQRNKSQVLLIASPLSREGKTTVAYNLALGLAEKGPTCFVDADLRKPNDGDVGGLFAHYRDAATEEELEAPSGDSGNLTCVSSGTGPENPMSILISDKFRRFTSAIRSRYEFVVIDSPPLLPYADGRFLAALADGAVLVGYAGLTARKALVSAAEILTEQAVPILGVVLNGVRAVEIPYRAY
jgi:uncharacterized protein involved in exopolysaccharide biosynthesis/Mrp family chromosome partitioning ATPase